MAIADPLHPGLAAYRRGDFAAAAAGWHAAGDGLEEPAERDLTAALVALAEALHAERQGDAETAARRFDEAKATLAGLPGAVLGVDAPALHAELARGLAVAAAAPPQPRPARRLPLGATLRFLSLFVLLAVSAALVRFTPLGELLDRERIVALFQGMRESRAAPLVLLGLYLVLAPIGLPMTPLIIAGGIVFGNVWGALYNTIGCVLGAAASYWLGRLLGRDFVRRLGRQRLKRIEVVLRRRGFWSLVGLRFLPIPFPVVNYGAAMAGLPFSTFILTSALGLAPSLAIYTWFASTLFEVTTQGGDPARLRRAVVALLAVMALSATPAVTQQLRRRRRYQRLVQERLARRPGT